MKNVFRKISAVLLAVVLFVWVTPMSSLGAESVIKYKGRTKGFSFTPGSEYSSADLFENFKHLMPGDVRMERVTIANEARGCDGIRVWMSMLLHDQDGNLIGEKVMKELEADSRKGDMSSLDYMHDFLSQLTLTIRQEGQVVYVGHPHVLADGFEDGNVYLGYLSANKSMKLEVELSVDIEMGNEYANRIGEVDWIFLVEEYEKLDSPSSGGGDTDSSPVPELPSVIIPNGDVDIGEVDIIVNVLPKTGDEDGTVWYWLLLAAGSLLMLVLLYGRRRTEP